jgi:hypothetical protein
MRDKLKELAGKAKQAASAAYTAVGDLNGDGVVDQKDAQVAAEWTRKTAGTVADEAGRLGKEAIRSDLAKNAAAGAAVGAVVAIPVPLIGPAAGAVVGAGIGVYKSLTQKSAPQVLQAKASIDIHAELLKLADLRERGVLTESEFEAQKRKLLSGDA